MRTLAMNPGSKRKPTAITPLAYRIESLRDCGEAKPEPRMTGPVLVGKLGEGGRLSVVSEAISAGG